MPVYSLLPGASQAIVAKRVALLIGNAAYLYTAPLANRKQAAALMFKSLLRGYDMPAKEMTTNANAWRE